LFFQKHNIPKDYNISMHYIPKERSGVCWVLLNIYPLEQSLRELAQVFGAISSNKDNIMIFITMLQNLRFKFDHEELVMPVIFKCHYRAVKWPSGQYFDYIRDILNSAAQGEGGFRCVPPPCPAPTTPGKKHAPTHSIDSAPTYSIHKSLPHRVLFSLSGSEAQDHEQTRSRGSLLSLLPIPVTACVFLIVWTGLCCCLNIYCCCVATECVLTLFCLTPSLSHIISVCDHSMTV
uniref:Kit ligand n=1 Tax=Oncorhynchus tshawytscha TaxID=74940 RepID=A0A8C8CHM3_ONCTS